jgi:hypothetical protein
MNPHSVIRIALASVVAGAMLGVYAYIGLYQPTHPTGLGL